MRPLNYQWRGTDAAHELLLLPVPGTAGKPFLFGAEPNRRPVEIRAFHMASTQVTQALWTHVMGSNPSSSDDPRYPVDRVSWNHITGAGGFLERINSGPILAAVTGPGSRLTFRLPSETEWEYAARGGPHWTDGFAFSGSNDIDAVAWYGQRWRGGPLKWKFLKWRRGLPFFRHIRHPTHAHEVATKGPNQLGLYDMSGNVWEWCQDLCADGADAIPPDGSPWLGAGDERRLRGGCHHNWDIHCTVWWRYGIVPDAADGCIGFRLALA